MAQVQYQASQDDDDLYSYFNKSVSAVQAHADRFEQDYARPTLKISQAFFDERPIAATFISIFFLLSFLPIASFIGFSIFAITSFTIIALTCAFLASVTVVLGFLSLLIFTLIVVLFSSILLTGILISVYSFARFVTLIREHGREGIWIWVEDTKLFAFNAHPSTSSAHSHKETERVEEWLEKRSLSGGADFSDQEAPGGLAVQVKHEDSGSTPSPNQTFVNEEVDGEGS